MRKLILLLASFCVIVAHGQNNLALHVDALLQSNAFFKPVSPLGNPTTKHENANKIVSDATYATLNKTVIKEITDHKYETIELSIPYNQETIQIQLYRVELATENFHVDTDKKSNVSYNPGVYYRGIIKNNQQSFAAFSFFEGEMSGIVSAGGINNLVIGKLGTSGNSVDYIVYSDLNIHISSGFECLTDDVKPLPQTQPSEASGQSKSQHCVSLYFELQYQFFTANNSDITETTNWFTAVFNNVQALFDNDGISVSLKSIYIWTEQDPYVSSSSSAYDLISQFSETTPSFNADAGHLVIYGSGNGVAGIVGGLCSNLNRSYSHTTLYYEDIPTYSWSVEVITHEVGHTLGSQHTHGCYWNGDNTAIDGCGTSVGYIEGNCPQGPIPDQSVGGTIMSYCHLVGTSGINFAHGFGPQPAQRIQDYIASSLCLGTDCVNSCVNSVGTIHLLDVTPQSATLSWDDQIAGEWIFGYAPYGTVISNWSTTTQQTVIINGLNANAYYVFEIRPVCDAPMETGTKQLIFSSGADWCNGATWTDVGGSNGDYTEKLYTISIIKPLNSDEGIRVTFDDFFTQTSDIVYVYDGIGINAPLIGSWNGYLPPSQPYQSSNVSGALTFKFISQPQSPPTEGWIASMECFSTLGLTENTSDQLNIYPNPVKDVLFVETDAFNNQPYSITDMQGRILFSGSFTQSKEQVDMSMLPKGIYFLQTTNLNGREMTAKIVKE